ncbi:MAG: hypothetical protein ABJC79_14500, partial [Acidimicrobiia bacterium]
VSAVLGIVLLVGVTLAFVRSRRAVTTWIFGTASLLAFFTTVYPPHNLRHSGHFALVLLAAAWYWRRDRGADPVRASGTSALLLALLGVSLVAGLVTSAVFLHRPFNEATRTADRIRALGPGVRVVTLSDQYGANVGAYLDRPVFSADLGVPIRFVRYDARTLFLAHTPPATLLLNARSLVDAAPHGAVVVANRRRHHLLAQMPGRWLTSEAKVTTASSSSANAAGS